MIHVELHVPTSISEVTIKQIVENPLF